MYQLIKQVASVDDFLRLRDISGLSPRSRQGAEKALPNSLFGAVIIFEGRVVGMGRVVGDGALNFDIVDVAVDPEHQGKGLGSQIMQAIMDYLDETAEPLAYITLMADVPQLYEKFGFKLSRPHSEGMYIVK